MQHTFFSAFIVLLLVLDPLGNLPVFLSVLRPIEPARRRRIVASECAIAFGVLLLFMLLGRSFLALIHLSEPALEVAGGVILFIIAIRMVFPSAEGVFGDMGKQDPFIFPLAIPLIAGPSAMATVLVLASQQPERMLEWGAALTCAMLVSAAVLLSADRLNRLLGQSAVSGIEKLMGLLLAAIAVEMTLAGLKHYFMH
jgi:MarC family membrane protein